jgi:hypothetical protein
MTKVRPVWEEAKAREERGDRGFYTCIQVEKGGRAESTQASKQTNKQLEEKGEGEGEEEERLYTAAPSSLLCVACRKKNITRTDITQAKDKNNAFSQDSKTENITTRHACMHA